LTYLYVDCENVYNPKQGLTLDKLPLRVYLAKAPTTVLSYAVDEDDPVVVWEPEDDYAFVQHMREALDDPDVCLVAHNYSYDARVLVHRFGLPYPAAGHCTIDLASGAWPQQPGGYRLANLARLPAVASYLHSRGVPAEKLSVDLTEGTREELEAYVAQDVEVARAIHRAALARLDERELRIEETTTRFRQIPLILDQERLQGAVETFNEQALEGRREALDILGADGENAFGRDQDGEDMLKSVKPHVIKELLLEGCAFDTPTISAKKISAAKLARNKPAARVLAGAGQSNRMLYHRRNVSKLAGVAVVDCELASFRSHTGRNSSPAVGKGINLLNLPKHDKAIAEPIRRSYRLPPGLCAVRADAANLEYRAGVLMTGCEHGIRLFEHDVFADPYVGTWKAATGQSIRRTDPERQVAKMMVLALEYLMSAGAWVGHLSREIAKPYSRIGIPDLTAIAQSQNWSYASVNRWTKAVGTKLGVPDALVTAAFHSHRVFHAIHPEFGNFARWLERAIKSIVAAPESVRERVVEEKIWGMRFAPDRDWFDMHLDPGLEGVSLAVTVGPWGRTVVWRDLAVRETPFGWGMTAVQAGNKGYRSLTKNLLIENPTQSLGRNAVAAAKLALEKRGYDYVGDVHDELFLVVDRTREAVLKARQDLIEVGGPGNSLGFKWSFLLDANEFSCTESWYEDSMGKLLPEAADPGADMASLDNQWWDRLRDGDESLLDNLW